MGKKRKYTYGFCDVPRSGPLTKAEAEFMTAKRLQGFPDIEIATMLGCTLAVLKRGLVVDEGFASSQSPEAAAREAADYRAFSEERRERNRIARSMTAWRSDAPNPLAKEASIHPELKKKGAP